ncbi:MAG: LuxR C-terminal-related transcriptional regulator [Mycobacterium pseudokansasii]|uniref:LuxR family transcriptional regulator n=1 Tax=Mycobacterium pseudokansasii TaxID=2341080 RepID=UPI0023F4EF8D|nr:LuxR family transcriptional regulator [Mycobacterium pseudokansasii]MBY0389071.1 LuxR C-terminal-related transcriptional regulator [Mycobacterium pseudokansasii]
MLASMSGTDPSADTTPLNWSDLGVSELLPTGTVTLLLADVEGSTRLWQTQPEEMTAAIARLDHTVCDIIAAHYGVRPVEQGEGDSVVVAFARASDAVACALALQRAPLALIRLRIGVHTGEVQLRDEGNYIGPTVNRTARLRDLAHGGQTVLSGTTEDLVLDRLPADAWLTDLGTHDLRDLPRPERVVQLCHPDLRNDFPPLRTRETVVVQHLPVQLTSFVGRQGEMNDVRQILADNRLVTLTGAGGVGKTRLAAQVAAQMAGGFADGVRYVDLAPITDPDLVPVAVIRVLGLPDQPGRATIDTLLRFIGERRMLMVLDNCEHLLDACAELVAALLGGCPAMTLVATSREPIGVVGEVTWRVPSLSLADEAIQLFTDRARQVRPDFRLTDDNSATAAEICRRLDGMPLAIELAASRVRVLSLTEIRDGLHDRFRLLTGGARTAVRRQQTLRASVDWSHALLIEPERILFRRLAVFMGGFDLDAAQAIAGGDDVESYQVLDLLTLLVDKSLVVAENTTGPTRYRLLETVRQYAQEKLSESGEAEAVRTRHRDHYTAMAALFDTAARTDHEQRLDQAETEIDNLRAAFGWSRENSDPELALALSSSLRPFWFGRGRIREGLTWFDAALTGQIAHPADVAPAVRARGMADNAMLHASGGATDGTEQASEAVAIAREVDDRALLARALTACGCINVYNPEAARPYFAEASSLARSIGDEWRLSEILSWQAFLEFIAGDPIATRAAAEEGRDLAEALGARFDSRACRWCLGLAQWATGELAGAVAQLRELVAEADAAHDVFWRFNGLFTQAHTLAHHGDLSAARVAVNAALGAAVELPAWHEGQSYVALAVVALAAGDAAAADDALTAGWHHLSVQPAVAALWSAYVAQAAVTRGDLTAARRWADEAVAATTGWHLSVALTTHARVSIAQGEPEQADRDAHDALATTARTRAYTGAPDTLECLATLAVDTGSHQEAARLLGAAEAIRQRGGQVRFKIFDAGYEASVAALREAMGEKDFEASWAEGARLSTDEAIAYAQRRRGERKRPTSGWASLTPTEREVVRLVSEGLANKDIATRLFVSPRTVQSHLTHVYTKLALSSRVQLVQEAARHT